MKAIKIGERLVGEGHPTFVVAEIGINHNGDIGIAKKLIDEAVKAGSDAVKFQKRTVDVVYTPEELAKPRAVDRSILRNAIKRGVLGKEAVERLEQSDFEQSTNGDLKRALEFTRDEYAEIDRHCKERNIMWFASPWDEASVDFMEAFNPAVYKIASASLTDADLLKRIRKTGKPIILSTGMSTLDMVRKAVDVLGRDNLILLHAVSTYPAENNELNLRGIHTLRETFDLPTGYSGHEPSLSPTFAAAVLGASLIERHITLDRAMWGSDHAASLGLEGLKKLVEMIRKWELAKGDGVKRILASEEPVMKKLRRKHTI